MYSVSYGPVREKPPFYGCRREEKTPGCHDHCGDYAAWKKDVDEVNRKRAEDKAKPFSRLM